MSRVTDSSGNVLLDNTPKPASSEPWAAASLTSVMQGVITNGTAELQMNRPAAGKTGTTNSSEMAIWFCWLCATITTAVWVGMTTTNL